MTFRLAIACLFLSLLQAPGAIFGWQNQGVFHIEVSSNAVKKLDTVREHIRAEQWEEALDLLRQTIDQQPQDLVPLGNDRFVTVQTYSMLLVAGLPAEGLKTYRSRIDTEAFRLLEEAREIRSKEKIQELLRIGFASSHGDDALMLLAEWNLSEGLFSEARVALSQLVPAERPVGLGEPFAVVRYPDSSYPLEEVRAKLVLCSLLEGNLRRAELELSRFSALHGNAEGTLGGRSGPLKEILKEFLRASEGWLIPEDRGIVRTLAGSPERTHLFPEMKEMGGLAWQATVPAPLRPDRAITLQSHPSDPAYHPVTYGSAILLNTGQSILAYDLVSGKPAWPGIHELDPTIFRLEDVSVSDVTGVPQFSATIEQGRLFARMGDLSLPGPFDLGGETGSLIVCLDLAGSEGALVWSVNARDCSPNREDVLFEGSPLVVGSRLFIGLREGDPQPVCSVVCLDTETGAIRWKRKICNSPSSRETRSTSHHLLTAGESRIFYAPDVGTVAALEQESGQITWMASYPRSEVRPGAGVVPIYFDGLVFVAPSDSDTLRAYEAATGILQWERAFSEPVDQLIGVSQERLIVSARQLFGIEPRQGQVKWRVGGNSPEKTTYGRGILAGEIILWPTREQLLMIGAKNGEIRKTVSLLEEYGIGGGNLCLNSGCLILAGNDQLSVFTPGRIKPNPGRDDDPDIAWNYWQRLIRNEVHQDWEKAVEEGEQVLRHARAPHYYGNRPLVDVTREHLVDDYTALAQKNYRQGKKDVGINWLKQALEVADNPSDVIATRLLLSEWFAEEGSLRESIQQLADLIIYSPWRDWRLGNTAASPRLQDAVHRVVQESILKSSTGRVLFESTLEEWGEKGNFLLESGEGATFEGPNIEGGSRTRQTSGAGRRLFPRNNQASRARADNEAKPTLMPLIRIWEKEIEDLPLIPRGEATGFFLGGNWCRFEDGQERWSGKFHETINEWFVSEHGLFGVGPHIVCQIDPLKGEALWKLFPVVERERPVSAQTWSPPLAIHEPEGPLGSAQFLGPLLLVQQNRHVLHGIDTERRSIRWRFRLKYRQVIERWQANMDTIALVARQPEELILLSAKTGTELGRFRLEIDPVKSKPQILANDRVVTLTSQNDLIALSAGGKLQWARAGIINPSFAASEILVDSGMLLFYEDGRRITRVSLTNGKAEWTSFIEPPSPEPLRGRCLITKERVILCDRGRIQGLDVHTGQADWSIPIGPEESHWELYSLEGGMLAIPRPESEVRTGFVIDLARGDVVQKLAIPENIQGSHLLPGSSTLLLITDYKMTAFRPMSSKR